MLNRYELLVAKEESERVDTLRYSWQKLQSLAVNICGRNFASKSVIVYLIMEALHLFYVLYFF